MPESDNNSPAADAELADLATQWSLLRLAHQDTQPGSAAARQTLVLRYSSSVRRYVAVMVRDPHVADEVAQEVMVRLMKGDFGVADPQRGRFRDLLRHSIRNMVRNHYAKENRRTGVPLDEQFLPGEEDALADPWLNEWVRSVLDLTWKALERYQSETSGSVPYTVLRLRSEHADEDSKQLAQRLSDATGRPFNAAAARQQLRRARLRFAQLLVEEIARGLHDPSPEMVENELTSLELMSYVRDFLPDDWREKGELRPRDPSDA